MEAQEGRQLAGADTPPDSPPPDGGASDDNALLGGGPPEGTPPPIKDPGGALPLSEALFDTITKE